MGGSNHRICSSVEGATQLTTAIGVMQRSRGFTLLEIVVALAILGMGVAVMMQIFSGGLKNIYRMHMAHHAMGHAENVMNQILSNQAITGETKCRKSNTRRRFGTRRRHGTWHTSSHAPPLFWRP